MWAFNLKSILLIIQHEITPLFLLMFDMKHMQILRRRASPQKTLHRTIFKSWQVCTCVHEMTGQGPPAQRKHVNNFRCDLFHDAGKTTWSGAMNTDRITIPRSKLWKYCHGQLGQVSRMSICVFSCTVA